MQSHDIREELMARGTRLTGSPATAETIVADIAQVTGLPVDFIRQVINYLYGEIEMTMITGKAIRIQGVGLLAVRLTENGEAVGRVFHKPVNNATGDLVIRSPREIIAGLEEHLPVHESSQIDYEAIWRAFCDTVKARLRHGYNVSIDPVGVLQPIPRRNKGLKWYISDYARKQVEGLHRQSN